MSTDKGDHTPLPESDLVPDWKDIPVSDDAEPDDAGDDK